jgi:hypothetical protein
MKQRKILNFCCKTYDANFVAKKNLGGWQWANLVGGGSQKVI